MNKKQTIIIVSGVVVGIATSAITIALYCKKKKKQQEEENWEESEEEFDYEIPVNFHKPDLSNVVNALSDGDEVSLDADDAQNEVHHAQRMSNFNINENTRQTVLGEEVLRRPLLHHEPTEVEEPTINGCVLEESEEKPDIVIISEEDYYQNPPLNSLWEKATLTYYSDDDVLTDESGEVVQNPELIVGSEALDSFGHLSNDPDAVYIENYDVYTMFEIIRLHKSYSESVLGYTYGDEELRAKKSRKREDD